MPYRWVLNPVVFEGGARKPKVSTLVDLGIPPIDTVDDAGNPIRIRKTYRHTSVISDGNGISGQNDAIAISLVRFVDAVNLDSDLEIETLSDSDELSISDVATELNRSAEQRLSEPARVTAILDKLQIRGMDVTGLGQNSSRRAILNRAARLVKSDPGDLDGLRV